MSADELAVGAQKACAFGGASLKGNRAKEHVLHDSWLKRLGHSKTTVFLDGLAGEVLVERREMAADRLQAGLVCVKCNGGWMNDADQAVETEILNLARADAVRDRPGLDRDLSRWIFKTAFAFSTTVPPARRHVPPETLDALRRGALPRSFVTFVHRTVEERHLAVSTLDVWPKKQARFQFHEQRYRFKFGVQYDNVGLGCAYVQWPGATFVLRRGIHEVVEVEDASHIHGCGRSSCAPESHRRNALERCCSVSRRE